ncbi:hypothetical protein RDV84_08150 [Lysobacter yananisis]|uniref:Uncharacterized protein n=2 Tax=Lysobacter yananisis TaxID=1003114 RepID=A0ABY9PEF4_9GAMM|nr:hypothetical protein [Lysobacter yananisis]WMT04798.1 hypothetical protein RDV84_08150 [Lysobacter yananisis]
MSEHDEFSTFSQFEVWGLVDQDRIMSAAKWMVEKLEVPITVPQAFREMTQDISQGRYVKVFAPVGWGALPELLEDLPDFVVPESAVFVEWDCNPNSGTEYCEKHRLYHQPGACPLDTGEFIR